MLLVFSSAHATTPCTSDGSLDAPRVATLGGSITEIVYALGQEDLLVGVDASSVYPQAVQELPQFGYFRQVSAEGVLSLAPTLVLAVESAGPPTSLAQIEAAGVEVVRIPDVYSVDGAKNKIRIIAKALDCVATGDALIAAMDQDLERFETVAHATAEPPRVLFIYARGGGTLNVSGEGTAADAMIQLAGGQNAIIGYTNYRPLTAEAVVAAAPDIILVLERGLATIGGTSGLMKLPGLALTPAGRNQRIVTIDDTLFLSFGPRLGEAVTLLHEGFFPDAP